MMCAVGSCAREAAWLLRGGDVDGIRTRDLPYCREHWDLVKPNYSRREYKRLRPRGKDGAYQPGAAAV